MNRRARGMMIFFPMAAIGLSAPASAQVESEKAQASEASVTLDQLSISDAARAGGPDRQTAVEVAQPARPSASAAVIASEVSRRSDGRSLTVAPAIGDDRCDGNEARLRTELCRRRIEARANQYNRPSAAPVTPEARLLLLTNPDGADTVGDIGRRQVPSGLDGPNGPAEQLAGALRDGMAKQDFPMSTPVQPGTLPPNTPPIVVIPPK